MTISPLTVSLDRTIGSKRHTVSATVHLRPSLGTSAATTDLGPVVQLGGGGGEVGGATCGSSFSLDELGVAVREGVVAACSQGSMLCCKIVVVVIVVVIVVVVECQEESK